MRKLSRKIVILTATLAVLGVSASFAADEVKKGKTRPLSHKQLMKGMVKPHGDAIKNALEKPPTDDKGWADLAMHAALLNESSYAMMEDGRNVDAKWEEAAVKHLRLGSEQIITAVEQKDIGAVKTAFGAAMRSCKACHDVHKPKQ
ncbi:MAG: hypothetical protein ACO1QB_11120 [Verrucomicrobiales bacterium]